MSGIPDSLIDSEGVVIRELYTVHFSCGHKNNDWGNENIFDSNNWPQTPLIFTTNILGNNYKHVF